MVFFLIALWVGVSLAGHAPPIAPQLPKDFCAEKEGTITMSTGECMCRYKCDGAKCQSGQGMVWYAYKDCPSGCHCLQAPQRTEFDIQRQKVKEEVSSQCSEEKTACGDDSEIMKTGSAFGTRSPVSARALEADAEKNDPVAAASSAAASVSSSQYDEVGDDFYGDEGRGYEGEHSSAPHEGEDVEAEEPLSHTDAVLEWLDENYRSLFGGAIVLLLACTLLPALVVTGIGTQKEQQVGSSRQCPPPVPTKTKGAIGDTGASSTVTQSPSMPLPSKAD